jgi:6-phosphogluconolactonase
MKYPYCVTGPLILTILSMVLAQPAKAQSDFWVYIGTNNHPPSTSEGIYLYRLDGAAGKVQRIGVAAKLGDPGWQVISRNGKFLYTIGTVDNLHKSIVAAYSADAATGGLTFLNQQETNGNDTTHVDIDPACTCAVTANYNSGDISVLPINADGTLAPLAALIKHSGSSVDPVRQTHPYAHSSNFDPTGRWVLVMDLGVDKIFVYRYDASTRSLSPGYPPTVATPPGTGPRHLSFSPDGKTAYAITEMGGILLVYSWDSVVGQLKPLQTVSTLPPDFTGTNKSAEVRILPNDKFLYASNRGPDNLAIFAINPDGTVKPIGYQPTGGKAPRDFAIDPTGNFLFAANQDSDSVTVFRVNQETGMLTPMGDTLSVPRPIAVTFLAITK